jgi:hypothetical protein
VSGTRIAAAKRKPLFISWIVARQGGNVKGVWTY